MRRWSGWVLAHKRLVVGFWLLTTIASVVALRPATDAFAEDFRPVPGREGFEANREIAALYGNGGDVAPIVLVVALPEGTTVDSPGVASELDSALGRVQEALPDARLASYASTRDRTFVSEDGRTTFALVYVRRESPLEGGKEDARRAQTALDGVTVGGSPVRVTGLDALRVDAGDAGASISLLVEVLVAAVGALVVLLYVFGSVLAIVPLLMAAVAIPTTFLLVWPLAEVTEVSIAVQFLVALIGLGLAIDYALLLVMRWREEGRSGVGNEAAVERALQQAGSAAVFSGTTVAISLLALVLLPVPALRTIGIGGLAIALVSVAVATTLLPVLLATVGLRLDWPAGRRNRDSRFWPAWARLVVRHRWAAALTAGGLLAGLKAAAFSIKLGTPRPESLAQTGSARAALVQLERSGIGFGPLTPFDALVRGGDPDDVAEALAGVEGASRARLRRRPGAATGRRSSRLSRPSTETRARAAKRWSASEPPRTVSRPRSRSEARPPRAPTGSTPSTATSR
jgi:putative drug exporter of the RND superfamily